MNNSFLVVNKKDNVAVALKNFDKNQEVIIGENKIKLLDFISIGDRIAICDIKELKEISQYGYCFALAKYDIKKGSLISAERIINTEFDIDSFDIDNFKNKPFHQNLISGFADKFKEKSFLGYPRKNGVGTRNYYILIPTSFCASDIAMKLMNKFDRQKYLDKYKNIDGIVAATHTEGCGCGAGDIIDRLLTVIRNMIKNPNCGGALIIDLGCEQTNYSIINKYLGNLEEYDKPIDFITIQSLGGTANTFKKGIEIIESKLSLVNSIKREKHPLSEIILGTECGASDSFSGITANPLIGSISDNIVDLGGKVILSETPEMLGTESILLNRILSKKTKEKFIKGVSYYKKLSEILNISMSGNLVAGNLKGGLINLTLKSLGSIQKGGSREIVDFLDYGEKISKKGLNLMNGPGNDFESVTGLSSSGANMILFSTGRGTTEGSLITPVIKVASNTDMFNRLNDDMDFNAGKILKEGIEKTSMELMEYFIKVASGEVKTSSERHKKRAFQIWSAGKLSL